ncbi:MAG: hypothetical protein JW712_04745 [Dehalococcoidales bacterium]|nr:hypothetical protein [Dehalococcoidales bacterium]
MNNIEQKKAEAITILTSIGIPINGLTKRRQERLALTLLAVGNIKPDTPWKETAIYESTDSWALSTREIIEYLNQNYGEKISSGSYDDVRRKDLIVLIEAGIVQRSVQNPNASTNNPQRRYAIIPEAGNIFRSYGRKKWEKEIRVFIEKFGTVTERINRTRNFDKVEVTIPSGSTLIFGPGEHNLIQKHIIEDFLPRFAPNSELLYVGDTSNKMLLIERTRLKDLGFSEFSHDTLPDIVAYHKESNRLFMIEAVHSSNPVSQLRHLSLERFTKYCKAPRIYVSVFANRKSFSKWLNDISWETEVWLCDSPSHMIHFDGEHYLTPYE